MLGLGQNHLEKDGEIMKEKISQRSFLEISHKSEKGSVCWGRAQVHQSRSREDLGLFRGLGLAFKDLSRGIKEKKGRKTHSGIIVLPKSMRFLS